MRKVQVDTDSFSFLLVMRILEVYDAELDFFVTVITPPTAHEAYATIHLTGGECNAQTCMHIFLRGRQGIETAPSPISSSPMIRCFYTL